MELLSFIWDIISTLVDGIKNGIFFIKDIALLVPTFISSLPLEISVLLGSAFTIIIAVFIYKLII